MGLYGPCDVNDASRPEAKFVISDNVYSKNLNLMVGFHTDDVHDVLNTDSYQLD
jgi:uncharacterized protein YehS (DUF1456 family)